MLIGFSMKGRVQRRAQALGDRARFLAGDRDVLYHGTRHAKAILESGKLFFSAFGDPVVCFACSPDEAAYWWATQDRGGDDGRSAIFVLDRRTLRYRYRVEPYDASGSGTSSTIGDEMEERVWCTDIVLADHLIGYVCGDLEDRTATQRKEAREQYRRLRQRPGRFVRTLPFSKCREWQAQEREKVLKRLRASGVDLALFGLE